VRVARGLGARVVPFAWTGDFAAARNRYVEDARCPWLLVLDADEVLLPVAEERVRALVARPATAYAFTIRNYFPLGGDGPPHAPSEFAGEVRPGIGCIVSRTVRLFPRRPGVSYRFPVHESLLPALREQRIRARLVAAPAIDHFGYLVPPEELARKHAAYAELGRRKLRLHPGYAPGYLELGRLHLYGGDADAAVPLLRECIRRSPLSGVAHYFYVLALLRGGRRAQAEAHLARALRALPRSSDLRYLRGLLAAEAGEPASAAADLAPALRRVSALAAQERFA
jgi:tetratricopeptide (TPR) repeat protein